MTPAQTIIAKELRSFFVSPVVYVIGAIFLAVVGLLSYQAVANASSQCQQPSPSAHAITKYLCSAES
jgi:ABC-2 type transport system permease protein